MKHSVIKNHTFRVLEEEDAKWISAYDVYAFCGESVGLPESWNLKNSTCMFFLLDDQLRLFLPWVEGCGYLACKAKTTTDQLLHREFARRRYEAMDDAPEDEVFEEDVRFHLSSLAVAKDLGILAKVENGLVEAAEAAVEEVTQGDYTVSYCLDVAHRIALLGEPDTEIEAIALKAISHLV